MTPIWDLAYQQKTHSLYAASFGRGAYSVPLTGLTVPVTVAPPKKNPPKVPPVTTPRIPATGLPTMLPLAAAGAAAAALLVSRTRRRRSAG
jgi:hypothetical protein